MRRVHGSIIALLSFALAGCNDPGELYQRPQAEVHELLRTVDVPLYMFGTTTDTQAIIDGSDPARMVWKITADDYSLMKFTATLIPDGESKTRVVVDVEGSREGKWGDIEARLQKVKEIRALYLASMTEAVDSTLDGRAYDMTATYPALMAATTANIGRLFPPSTGGNGPPDQGNGR
ncbi:MAG: hypothetical protein ABIU10_03065 [Sphingomicrobium sp.]